MAKLVFFSLLLGFTACFNAQEIKHRPDNLNNGRAVTVSLTNNDNMKPSFYDFKMKTLDGQEVSLAQFKGKKVIILNVASECGYTPQYADWEKFYKENKESAVVLGFPCNQFMGQEPGDNATIQSFCQKNYGVTFPIFEKTEVKGDNKSPLYAWLTDKSQNGWNDQEPSWNFCKYLVNEKGELVEYFASKIKPDHEEFQKALNK